MRAWCVFEPMDYSILLGITRNVLSFGAFYFAISFDFTLSFSASFFLLVLLSSIFGVPCVGCSNNWHLHTHSL